MTMPGRYFDFQGQPVSAVEPAEIEHDEPDEIRLAQREATLRLLATLAASGRTPAEVGRQVELLAHACHVSPREKQADVAKFMDVSPGRVSQLKRKLKESLGKARF